MNGSRLLLEMGLWVVGLNTFVVLLIMARRSLRAQAGYAVLLASNLALAVFLLVTSNVQSPLSFVCIGAFVFMVLLPPVVSRVTRWALTREHMRLAVGLTTVREMLQPGAGVGLLRRALVRLSRVRRGEVEAVIDELKSVQASASPGERKALDMEILSVLLSSRRYPQAVEHFQEHVGVEVLVFHTPLAAGMVQAYGEERRLDRMGQVMELTEDSPAAVDPASADALTQARVAFLAQAGQAEALEELLDPSSGFGQTIDGGMRSFWLGVARSRAGDREGAAAALREAHKRLNGRSIVTLVERHLDDLDRADPPVDLNAVEGLGRLVEKVVGRSRVQAALPRLRGGSLARLAPVTMGLIVLNVVIWVLLETMGSGSGHPGTLIAAGANLKAAVGEGQVYRLAASVFLHAHWVHLALNMLVLWILGRLSEQLLGSARFWVTFVLSGVAGSLASFLWGGAPLSVGASGAIFGLVGGSVATLVTERGQWPEAWRRSMIRLLTFLGIISLLPGLTIRIVDNWAHVGGLLGGAIVGSLMMGPLGGKSVSVRRIHWVLAAITFCGVAWTGIEAARSGGGPLPFKAYSLGSHRFALPTNWHRVSRSRRVQRFQHLNTDALLLIIDDSAMRFRDAEPAQLLRQELESRRKEAVGHSAVFRKTGPVLIGTVPPGWVQATLFYRSEGAELVHGVFLKKKPRSPSVLIVNIRVLRDRVGGVRKTLDRLLRSFN
jgi:rhomboid protease GluP